MSPRKVQLNSKDRAFALNGSRQWLDGHLQRLSNLPAHGNRKLHIDQLLMGLLLSFYDPAVRSLRLIQAKKSFGGELKLDRCARATTSAALATFDPQLLVPVIKDLQARVPALSRQDEDLAQITRRIIAADGTYLSVMCSVIWALKLTKSNGASHAQVRANVQLDTLNWIPQVLSVSGDDGESEPAAFVPDLLSGVLYVVDRNFVNFDFFKALLSKDNDFVARIKSNSPRMRTIESRTISDKDAAAGVVEDQIVELIGKDAPAGNFRLVTIHTTNRKGEVEIIRLLTNLLDEQIAAATIGAIYRQRWQIELFFKWLKTWAQMDHLLSTSRKGITFQLYVAVIAVLLMYVQSGKRVSRYALAALGWVAQGTMSMADALEVIEWTEREKELARKRQAKRRAQQKLK